MKTRHFIAPIIVFALIMPAAKAQDLGGNPGDYPVNHDPVMENMMPELRNARPPTWLKPGMRLIWYTAFATIPQSYVGGLVQDAKGEWREIGTGKSFRADEAAGTASHGYSVLDVLAVHDDVTVVSFTQFTIQGGNGALRLAKTGVFSTPAGYLPACWVNRQILAQHADTLAAPGILVARMPYAFGNKQHDSLWTSVKSDSGQVSCVTDLASGIVLHTGIATATAGRTVDLGGINRNVGGQTSLAQTTFKGVRQLQTPWANAPMPQSLASIHKLIYTGTTTLAMQGLPVSWPTTSQCVITARGKDFLQARRTTTIDYRRNGVLPSLSVEDFASGNNELTPLAIPPEALTHLQTGQVLDRDPITAISTAVSFLGRDQRGNDVVVISSGQGGATGRIDCIYDRNSGLLIGTVLTDPTLFSTVRLSLTGKE